MEKDLDWHLKKAGRWWWYGRRGCTRREASPCVLPCRWHITCRWEAYISVTQYYIFRSNCMPSCARAVDKETLSQCETTPDRRKRCCKEWSKDAWSDQPWKGNPREVRIVGIPAAKTLEQELASQGKLTSTMITWFERHWVESGLVGGDGGDHLQPPLCSAESHQNPFPTKAWEVFVKILQRALNRTRLLKIDLFRKASCSFFLTFREAGFPVNASRLKLIENIKW